MRDTALIVVAEALDRDDCAAALGALHRLSPRQPSPVLRDLLISLWRRAVQMALRQRMLTGTAVRLTLKFLDLCESSRATGNFWAVHFALQGLEEAIGAETVGALALAALWDDLPGSDPSFRHGVLARVSVAGNVKNLTTLWDYLLRECPDFVPDYWLYQALAKATAHDGEADVEQALHNLLGDANRNELKPLFAVYFAILRQRDLGEAFRLARLLTEPAHRAALATYLVGASQTNEHLPAAVDLHRELADGDALDDLTFMQARLAVLGRDWHAVMAATENLIDHSSLKEEALCLRALALAHLGAHETAKEALDYVRSSTDGPWFLKARATLLNVSRRMLREGTALPNDQSTPRMPVTSGRPTAQALWIGPRLRWIEQASIRSFILNGWRYHLYVYEIPDNVPDGVEIRDANAILPHSEVFMEGSGSGAHAGSLGAFSDLFRYALLEKRGGMWTDTDVINLDPFEPDGARFVSTEFTDAGLVTVNGAMMAAPAGDPLQRLARERAEQLRNSGAIYFTRIGPQLIAEMLGDGGPFPYQLMPTSFLNPIGWMETGTLLIDYYDMLARKSLQDARNIHVYTETWRLIGLDLTAPPADSAGFLAVLHDRLMNASPAGCAGVRSLLRH